MCTIFQAFPIYFTKVCMKSRYEHTVTKLFGGVLIAVSYGNMNQKQYVKASPADISEGKAIYKL